MNKAHTQHALAVDSFCRRGANNELASAWTTSTTSSSSVPSIPGLPGTDADRRDEPRARLDKIRREHNEAPAYTGGSGSGDELEGDERLRLRLRRLVCFPECRAMPLRERAHRVCRSASVSLRAFTAALLSSRILHHGFMRSHKRPKAAGVSFAAGGFCQSTPHAAQFKRTAVTRSSRVSM